MPDFRLITQIVNYLLLKNRKLNPFFTFYKNPSCIFIKSLNKHKYRAQDRVSVVLVLVIVENYKVRLRKSYD